MLKEEEAGREARMNKGEDYAPTNPAGENRYIIIRVFTAPFVSHCRKSKLNPFNGNLRKQTFVEPAWVLDKFSGFLPQSRTCTGGKLGTLNCP